MPSVTFTLECVGGAKKVRVHDLIRDTSQTFEMRAGDKESAQVFAVAGEGEIAVYCTCPQQSENQEPCVKERPVRNGDVVQVPGCDQG